MSAGPLQPWGTYQLLTGPGPAAIAVLRVRGPLCAGFVRRHLRPRSGRALETWGVGSVLRCDLLDEGGLAIDDILVSVHEPGPDWDLRLHLHGSPGLVRCCRELLAAAGLSERGASCSTLWKARHAIEGEAWALLPALLTLEGVRWLLRQVDTLSATLRQMATTDAVAAARTLCRQIIDRRHICDWFARPLRVALIGPPNAGKSTLANALADQHVSLVSPLPGTTRDWIEIPGEVLGFPVVWLDTAGLGGGADALATEAAGRTGQIMATADALVLVFDAAAVRGGAGDLAPWAPVRQPACVALNKCDLLKGPRALPDWLPAGWRERAVWVSALRRTGLAALTERLLLLAGRASADLSAPAAFTARQVAELEGAARANDADEFRRRVRNCLLGSPATS